MGFNDFDEAEAGLWQNSEAVNALRQIHVKQTPEGLVMSRACEQCALEVDVLIPWSEVYCASNQVFPQEVGLQQWAYNKRHSVMHPHVMCPHCAGSVPTPVLLPMGPDEAQKYFTRAAKGNVIDQNQANVIRAIAARVKQLVDQRTRRR